MIGHGNASLPSSQALTRLLSDRRNRPSDSILSVDLVDLASGELVCRMAILPSVQPQQNLNVRKREARVLGAPDPLQTLEHVPLHSVGSRLTCGIDIGIEFTPLSSACPLWPSIFCRVAFRLAKVAFEKCFMRKVRTESLTPIYETFVLKALARSA